jgi:integrase
LPSEILAILSDYLEYQAKYIESLGDKWITQIKGLNDELVDNDRLFTAWNGKPMSPPTPSKYFQRFCKKNGLTYRKNHSLRHFNASVQVNAGVDIKTISSNLGHSLCSTTLNVYCKQFQAAQAASMDKIVEIIGLPPVQVESSPVRIVAKP